MTLFKSDGRAIAAMALMATCLVGAGTPQAAEPMLYANDDPPTGIVVTAKELAASNEEVKGAYAAMARMWTTHFEELGEEFVVPRLLRYRGNVRSECGIIPANNAAYCDAQNAIYFDEVFVAGLGKGTGRALGTDGDMASVGVIAHEVGHAVAIQLGRFSRYTYDNEAAADCLAGAFARQSEKDGSLEKGDVEEAFYGMATAADPTPQLTGNRRVDARTISRTRLMGHGTREQRMANFRSGLTDGPGACLPDFRQRE
jgi:predicted metalloprotease